MVENDGQALRDQANIVFARSLGWKPSTDTPAEGQPTSTTTKAERTSAEAKAARAYLAAEYGQDPVYNDIDHSFSKGAIKAVVQSASREQEGVQFADLNRTQWGAKALTSTRGAKILDALPGGQLSDSRTRSRTHSAGTSHGGSRGRGAEMRPSALSTDVDGIRYEGHEGNYTGTAGLNTSSSNGSGSGSNQAVKGYQESDQLRQGPVYLIEHDTTWAFAAGSKLKTPAAFHSEDPSLLSTSPSSRPTRWAMGQVTIRTAEWYSESDAIAMGFLTPDQAKDTAPVVKQLAKTRKEFTEAEAAYADTRAPLEGLAERYAAEPADERAESAYNAQEKKYEDALKAFNKQIDALGAATNTVRTTFGGVGQGTDGGTAPPARTPSGDGSGGTTRAPAPADNTTATGTTGTPATGSTDNTGVTSGTTTSTGNTGDVTTTTGGPLPSIIVTPPGPEPAPTEPAPTEPAPTEPAPTEPAPTEPAPTEPAPTEPRQNLVDHFRTALNLEVPKSDSPVQDTEGGLEQNTDTIDAQVQRASDAADTAAQAARDARVAVNGLSTTLDRGRADLQDGNRFLEGSGGEVPAAGTEGRSPVPGADGAPAPGAVRQAQDAQQAANTAHGNATTVARDITTTRNNATATAPVVDQRALLGQLRTAVSEAKGADTSAADAQRTSERHAQTVTGLGNELDGARTRHQALSTAVDGLSGQDRAAGGGPTAQDTRARADDLISELEGIADRADTARAEAETAATQAETAQTDADTAKTTADRMAADAKQLQTWAEALDKSASGHQENANRAARDARNAGAAARGAADAAREARAAADAARARADEVREEAANAIKAETDARAARTTADRAVQAAANTPRPSPEAQTGTTGTPENTALRDAENARERAKEAQQTAREAAKTAARAHEEAEKAAQEADNLRERAAATAQDARKAAALAKKAQKIAERARDSAEKIVRNARPAATDARQAHKDAQEAAQKAKTAAERAAEAAKTAQEARNSAEKIADSARKDADEVRELRKRIPAAVEPGRTSSENDRKKDGDEDGSRDGDGSGSSGDRGDDNGSDGNRSDGERDSGTGHEDDSRRGGEDRDRGTDGDGGRSSRGDGRGDRDTHDSGDPAQRDTDSDTDSLPDLTSDSDSDDSDDDLDDDFYGPAPAVRTQEPALADSGDPWAGNPPTGPDLSALIAADKKKDDRPSTVEDVVADLTYRYRPEDIGHHTAQDAQIQVFMAGHHRSRHGRRTQADPSEQYTDTDGYEADPGPAYPAGTQVSQYPAPIQYTQDPTGTHDSSAAAHDQQPTAPTEETAQAQDGNQDERTAALMLWNGTFTGIEDLAATTGFDVVSQEQLVEDGSDGSTSLMRFENGAQAVYKDTEETTFARERADAEQLASLVGRAIGANVPGVLRIGEYELFMHFMNGVSGFTHLDNPRSPLLNTRDGHVLGLLDLLIANGDRNPGNWLDQGNGHVAGIDHGKAWFKYEHTPEDPTDLEGLAYTNGMRPFYDFEANAWIANPLTRADIRFLRTRLAGLYGEFVRLGRSEWFDEMMERFDMLARNARGPTASSQEAAGDPCALCPGPPHAADTAVSDAARRRHPHRPRPRDGRRDPTPARHARLVRRAGIRRLRRAVQRLRPLLRRTGVTTVGITPRRVDPWRQWDEQGRFLRETVHDALGNRIIAREEHRPPHASSTPPGPAKSTPSPGSEKRDEFSLPFQRRIAKNAILLAGALLPAPLRPAPSAPGLRPWRHKGASRESQRRILDKQELNARLLARDRRSDSSAHATPSDAAPSEPGRLFHGCHADVGRHGPTSTPTWPLALHRERNPAARETGREYPVGPRKTVAEIPDTATEWNMFQKNPAAFGSHP
ncbi:hypothetical protein HFP72_27375 [Nocardiopsis sp. ARC36]